jgi:hypothetical protein
MIPGASKAMKDVEIEDDAFKHIEKRLFTLWHLLKEETICNRCEKKNQNKVLELKTSQSTDETVWPNEQDDENDARSRR